MLSVMKLSISQRSENQCVISQFQFPNSQCLEWVILVISIFFFSPSLSDPRTSVAHLKCENSNLTANRNFDTNFVSVMEHLSQFVTKQQWGNYSIESPSPPVFGFTQCHKDLSETDCQICFKKARTKLSRCLPAVKGRIYLEGCFIRYDEYNFFEESINEKEDSHKCSPPAKFLSNEDIKSEFVEEVEEAVRNVTEMATGGGGFGAVQVKTRVGVLGAYLDQQINCFYINKSIDL